MHEILTLEFQWPQMEEAMLDDGKLGIEHRVLEIVFQGIPQGQTIFWLPINKGMIFLRNKEP